MPRASATSVEPIATTTESVHIDTGLVNDVTYCYEVTAVDGTGNESAPTDPVCATPTASGGGTVHVADLDASTRARGKSGRWEALVTVRVHDDGNTPVGVVGRFTTTGRYLIVTVYKVTES